MQHIKNQWGILLCQTSQTSQFKPEPSGPTPRRSIHQVGYTSFASSVILEFNLILVAEVFAAELDQETIKKPLKKNNPKSLSKMQTKSGKKQVDISVAGICFHFVPYIFFASWTQTPTKLTSFVAGTSFLA